MAGTSFSVTEASRWVPPKKIKPDSTTSTAPASQAGMPKAFSKAAPMELDWTMQPRKPRARMMATAKKPARNRPKPPGKAARI